MDVLQYNFSDAGAEKCFLISPIDGTRLKADDGSDVYIEVYGADSDVYRKASRQITNKKLNQKPQQRQKTSVEELDESASKILAAATKSWHGLTENGVPLEQTPAEFERIYNEFPWIKEQVDEFVNDRGNFTKQA